MSTFKCQRCKRVLPLQAKPISQLDFCVDCKKSDLKDAEQYFRNGHWKKLPRYLEEIADGSLK